jgi:hypothetical protein
LLVDDTSDISNFELVLFENKMFFTWEIK